MNPADGDLYAASHFGVFRIEDDGETRRIADRWQDTMAFTVTGPDTFLASGHPDLREDLPRHLGLIESTDAAATWSSVSLAGEADFHALEVADRSTYGFDSLTGRLVVSQDRQTWTTIGEAPVIDLAWLGRDADQILASTARGLAEYRTDGTTTKLPNAPPVLLIDSPEKGTLVGVTASGEIYSTRDPSSDAWRRHGSTPGHPQALEATSDVWYVATDRGVFSSDDVGETWRLLVPTAADGH
ncbi:hypothetical protein E7Z54_07055 [Nocardioides sp.]|nr:hypothetical protein [Nocardioides sp.]THJ05713.1 hypothetical protein E7Z54_07055 [Nocardioides sp.]